MNGAAFPGIRGVLFYHEPARRIQENRLGERVHESATFMTGLLRLRLRCGRLEHVDADERRERYNGLTESVL